ncbi:hypothetical protein [Paenibacillus xylanilyticus]|uniref:hypothetical protein n=1 Tax=Paenibacillus xylanilyticus TaxID=248903 RepID=UPI001586ECD3|nr:hypothetical protein [Paenibacillus xylanilyticus]
MTIEFAKFTAEVAKGIKIGSDVEVKLLIPLKSAVPFLEFLSNSQGQDVMVHLGDPQAAFDFEDEDDRDPMYNTWNGGRRVTTDSSGVVTQIEKPGSEPEHDENQAQLFGPAEPPMDQEQPTGDGQETDDGDGQPTVPPTGDDDSGNDPNDPYGDDDSTPAWINEDGADQSGSKEMDFSSEDSEGEQQLPAGDKEVVATEIDKEQLEKFILSQRPIFDDIKLADAPADFPTLLQQRNEGKTWMEISKEINVPSGQISSKYGAYKKRVTKMIQDGVAV